jgi:two-component system sensor histidine kinase VicK
MEIPLTLNCYRAIFEIIPIPCIIMRTDMPRFTIVEANKLYLELSMGTKDSILGRPFFEGFLLNSNDDEADQQIANYQNAFIQLLETKRPVQHETISFDIWDPYLKHYKKKHWSSVSKPVFNEYGEIIYIVLSPMDVTENQELLEREDVMKEASVIQTEFYESVFFQAPVGIGMWEGADFITRRINPALASFYGQQVEALIGKPIFDIFPKSKNLWATIMSHVYKTGKPYTGIELPVDLEYGGETKRSYVNFGIVPYISPKGDLTGVLGVSVDTTQQVHLRKTLEESELKMKIAVESARLGVWDVDLRSQQVFSSSYIWIPGFPMEKGTYSLAEFLDTILPEHRSLVDQAFNGSENNFSVQVKVKWLDASIHWIQLTGNILKDDNNKPLRVVGTTLDITDQKELERRKDELLSTVSHELKTPVTSIKAIAQMLERKFNLSDDKSTADLLHKLVNQVRRLTNLIHDLLDASLIEGGKLQLNKTHFLLDELVKEVISEIQRTTVTHKINIKCEDPIHCFSDKERIRQVIINLLTNAIKYSPKSDQVNVSVSPANQHVLCCVQDYGIGISEEKAGKIFERFYRVIDDKHSGFQGIGIGLYISHQIINRLDGKIWFESNEGLGTTFCFEVPQF